MPFALVGPERIFYLHHKSALQDAPHLILVHGSGGSHQHWGFIVRSVTSANVVALDLPGHGRSAGAGRRSTSDYAAFVLQFMDELRIHEAVLAGHSLGGAVALTLAFAEPARVAGLVLVASGARLRVLPAILEGTLSAPADTVRTICTYAYGPNADPELVQRGLEQMSRVAPRTLHGDFSACDAFDVMARLGELRCPTLVIGGTEDKLSPPKYATFLAEKIAGAELVLVEGAGHMVMVEQPDAVAQAISSALARWRLPSS